MLYTGSGRTMTLSELGRNRKYALFGIFVLCLLPWFLSTSRGVAQIRIAYEIIIPALALVGAYFYTGADLGGSRWRKEIGDHVGERIKSGLLELLPGDLEVTDDEKRIIADQDIIKGITGIFWEAIERNGTLKSQKGHFYANGFMYSTSIDLYLICSFAGFCYAGLSLALGDVRLAYAAAFLLAIAVASRTLVTPRLRERHMSLSSEQIDFIRKEEADFVSSRFRKIIQDRRKGKRP